MLILILWIWVIGNSWAFEECNDKRALLGNKESGIIELILDVNATFSLLPYFEDIQKAVPEKFKLECLEILRDSNDDHYEDLLDLIGRSGREKRGGNLWNKIGKGIVSAAKKGGKAGAKAGAKAAKPLADGIKNAAKKAAAKTKPKAVLKYASKTGAEALLITGVYIGIDKLLGKDNSLQTLQNITEWSTMKMTLDAVLTPMKSKLYQNLQNLLVYQRFEEMPSIVEALKNESVGLAAISTLSSSFDTVNVTFEVDYNGGLGYLCYEVDPGVVNGSQYIYTETVAYINKTMVSECLKNYENVIFCKPGNVENQIIREEIVSACFQRSSKTKDIVASTSTHFKSDNVRYQMPSNGVIVVPKFRKLSIDGCMLKETRPTVHEVIHNQHIIHHHELETMKQKLEELEKSKNEGILEKFWHLWDTFEGKLITAAAAALILIGTIGIIVIRCC